jgi:amino acid transporter
VAHFVSAGVLFGIFALFCLWLFRKKAPGEVADRDKKNRNAVYLICGIVIIVCIVWAIYEGRAGRSIFWPESVAMIFFAISWLVKGYALKSIGAVARSLLAPGDVDDSAHKPH